MKTDYPGPLLRLRLDQEANQFREGNFLHRSKNDGNSQTHKEYSYEDLRQS